MAARRIGNTYTPLQDQGDLSDAACGADILSMYTHSSVDQQALEDPTIDDDQNASQQKLLNNHPSEKIYHDDDFLLPARSIESRSTLTTKKRFLTGWRIGALASALGATTVFFINLAITIWVWKTPKIEYNDGTGTLYQGSCARVRELNVYIHLIVNVLSTLLLCSSNYCQQVLNAPSREELGRAHARRNWLHIGVPNLRNLWHIGWDRSILWILLFLSSVPLHLLFNSIVFTSLQANEYAVVPVTQDWQASDQTRWDTSGLLDFDDQQKENISYTIRTQYTFDPLSKVTLRNGSEMDKYIVLPTTECFVAYDTQYVSAVGNLYLVQKSPTVMRNLEIWRLLRYRDGSFEWAVATNDSDLRDLKDNAYSIESNTDSRIPFVSRPDMYPSNWWRCPSHTPTCDPDNEFEIPRRRSAWQPYEAEVLHCMIEQVEEICKLQFSFTIAFVVIGSNFVKAMVMVLLLYLYWNHGALVTIGDAIPAFLEDPDPETYGRCLITKRDVGLLWNWNEYASIPKLALSTEPARFTMRRRRWARAPSTMRWWLTYFAYTTVAVLSIPCIVLSLKGMPKDLVKLWKTGFATVNGNNLLNFGTSLLPGILLANAPQVILSYLYIALNALYTNMFVSAEWASYMETRKPLRVTSPTGHQRETYWLNVPFRYAIPMTIMSGFFHWLASQSIFKVQIVLVDLHTRQIFDQISTCGYSPVAIILTTIFGFIIAASGVIVSRFWYPAGMPLASSCSAAISAACHTPPEESGASLLTVQWGAVTHGKVGDDGEEPIGHCCFSSLPVEVPIPGRLYA